MNSTNYRLSRTYLSTTLLFLLFSFVAIRSDDTSVLRIPNFLALVVGILLNLKYEQKRHIVSPLLILAFVLIYSLGVNHLSSSGASYINAILAYSGIFALGTLAFSRVTVDSFNRVGHTFITVYTTVSLLIYFINLFPLPYHFGVDTSYVPFRLCAFFTEPSNSGMLYPAAFLYSIYQRKYRLSMLVFTCIILTFSPTVFLTLISTSLTLFTIKFASTKIQRMLYLLLGLFLIIAIAYTAAQYLSLPSEYGPIATQINRISEGIRFLFTGGEEGHNSRGAILFDFTKSFFDQGLSSTLGSGFGSTTSYSQDLGSELMFDVNLVIFFVISFGLYLGISVYVLLYGSIISTINTDLIGIMMASQLNFFLFNNGGIWNQLFFFCTAITLFKSVRSDTSAKFKL